MNDMIKAEREKILSRKPTRFLFIMGIVLQCHLVKQASPLLANVKRRFSNF